MGGWIKALPAGWRNRSAPRQSQKTRKENQPSKGKRFAPNEPWPAMIKTAAGRSASEKREETPARVEERKEALRSRAAELTNKSPPPEALRPSCPGRFSWLCRGKRFVLKPGRRVGRLFSETLPCRARAEVFAPGRVGLPKPKRFAPGLPGPSIGAPRPPYLATRSAPLIPGKRGALQCQRLAQGRA